MVSPGAYSVESNSIFVITGGVLSLIYSSGKSSASVPAGGLSALVSVVVTAALGATSADSSTLVAASSVLAARASTLASSVLAAWASTLTSSVVAAGPQL